jgi:hypothetical protein
MYVRTGCATFLRAHPHHVGHYGHSYFASFAGQTIGKVLLEENLAVGNQSRDMIIKM